MGNRIYIDYLKVLKLENDGTVRIDGPRDGESYAWSVWDDNSSHFDFGIERFEDLRDIIRPENAISFLKSLDEWGGLADYALERGLSFNGDWYTPEELQKIQEPEEDDSG
jgi:hypothetical protein